MHTYLRYSSLFSSVTSIWAPPGFSSCCVSLPRTSKLDAKQTSRLHSSISLSLSHNTRHCQKLSLEDETNLHNHIKAMFSYTVLVLPMTHCQDLSDCSHTLSFLFLWGDCERRGWYDNSQLQLRPCSNMAQCSCSHCVCEFSLLVCGVSAARLYLTQVRIV